MKRKAYSIFQYKERWYGISLALGSKGIEDVEFLPESSLDDLNSAFRSGPCAVSLESSGGYVAGLQFPFGGRRRIGLVIRDELEEFFPFPVEEMAFDFQELGKGNVLVAAAPRQEVDGLKWGRHIRSVSLNSLSAFNAMRHFNLSKGKDFIFLHVEGKRVVIIAFKDDKLRSVRQVFYSEDVEVIREAVSEYTGTAEFQPAVIFVTGESEGLGVVRDALREAVGIPVESPSLMSIIKNDTIPDFALIGVGSALTALAKKGEINLMSPGREAMAEVDMRTVYLCAGAIGLGLILLGLSYFNLLVKEKAYQHLSREETMLYRSAFPKTPPVKDIERAFQDKIKGLEKDQTGAPSAPASSPLAVLSELSSRIDTGIDVKINEYAYDGDEFVISGATVSFASVEKIKAIVEQVKGVRGVDIQNVDLAASKQVKFKIRGRL
jgi:hypothetical protein